jgi:hypothetical protein
MYWGDAGWCADSGRRGGNSEAVICIRAFYVNYHISYFCSIMQLF